MRGPALAAAVAVLLTGCSQHVSAPDRGAERLAQQREDPWGTPWHEPPLVHAAADLSPAVERGVRESLASAARAWGAVGPLEYWIVGTDEAALEELVASYCARRQVRGDWTEGPCTDEALARGHDHNFRSYLEVGAEALRRGQPQSSMGWNGRREWSVHLYTSSRPFGFEGLLGVSAAEEQKTVFHEYFHAVQNAAIHSRDHEEREALMGPVWFVEGGAEFMAERTVRRALASGDLAPLPGGNLPPLQTVFARRMEAARDLLDRTSPGARIGELGYDHVAASAAYDLGAWAVALLLHGAGDDALLTDFYPRLDALGWDGAFEATFGRSAASFEEEFARFLRQPLDAQLKVVPDL
jgi:hypothetical protein